MIAAIIYFRCWDAEPHWNASFTLRCKFYYRPLFRSRY